MILEFTIILGFLAMGYIQESIFRQFLIGPLTRKKRFNSKAYLELKVIQQLLIPVY